MSETAAITSLPPASMTPKQADGATSGSDGSFKQVMDQVSTDKRAAPAQEPEARDDTARADAGDATGAPDRKEGKDEPATPDAAANPAAALPLAMHLLPAQTVTAAAAPAAAAGQSGTKAGAVDAALATGDAGTALKQTLASLKDSAMPGTVGRTATGKNVSAEKAPAGANDAVAMKNGGATKNGAATAGGETGQVPAKAAATGEFSLDKAAEARATAPDRPATEASQAQTPVVGTVAQAAPLRSERPDAAALVQTIPVTHPRFGEAIAQQIMVLAQDGVQHAKISLNPADLGPVEVRISLRQDEATVQLAAASGVTRHAIEDALPKLRDMLDQVGVRLGDTGVFAQLPQKGGAENFGAWRPDHAPLFGAAADLLGEEELPGLAPLGRVANGLVDAYV